LRCKRKRGKGKGKFLNLWGKKKRRNGKGPHALVAGNAEIYVKGERKRRGQNRHLYREGKEGRILFSTLRKKHRGRAFPGDVGKKGGEGGGGNLLFRSFRRKKRRGKDMGYSYSR